MPVPHSSPGAAKWTPSSSVLTMSGWEQGTGQCFCSHLPAQLFQAAQLGSRSRQWTAAFWVLDTATFIELMCLKANLEDFVPVILRMEGFTLKLSCTHWVWKQSQDTSLPARLLGSAVPSQHSLKHAGDTQWSVDMEVSWGQGQGNVGSTASGKPKSSHSLGCTIRKRLI